MVYRIIVGGCVGGRQGASVIRSGWGRGGLDAGYPPGRVSPPGAWGKGQPSATAAPPAIIAAGGVGKGGAGIGGGGVAGGGGVVYLGGLGRWGGFFDG